MKKFFLLMSVVITSFLMSACNPFTEETEQERQNRLNEQEILDYLQANNLTAQQTDNGLYYIINKPNAAGQVPELGDLAEMHYVGSLLSGTIVDSTSPFLNEPKTFIFDNIPNASEVLFGIESVASFLKEGEEATLLLPSRLAFGRLSNSTLPPYSVVRYDISSFIVKTEQEQITEFIANDTLTNYQGIDSVLTAYITQIPDSQGAKVAAPDSIVTVSYTGRFLNGTIFDSNDDFSFTVRSKDNRNIADVIEGWDRALNGMKVGEKKRILLFSDLAYGAQGNTAGSSNIGPYTVLWFDIELKDVN
ncbi:MAG TPA: hypothetical protein DCS93_04320 [Microscillaceae bacterium]|nr:hypothetical protein [Microscillaceae bacterium]